MSIPYFIECECGNKEYDGKVCGKCGEDLSSYDASYYCEDCDFEGEGYGSHLAVSTHDCEDE